MTALAYVYGGAALLAGLALIALALLKMELEWRDDHGRVSKGWRREHGGGGDD